VVVRRIGGRGTLDGTRYLCSFVPRDLWAREFHLCGRQAELWKQNPLASLVILCIASA